MEYGFDAKTKILSLDPFEQARNRAENLIKSLRPVKAKEYFSNNVRSIKEYIGVEVPVSFKQMITRGNTALVFRLENVFTLWDWNKSEANNYVDMVAKSSFYEWLDSNRILLVGKPANLQRGSLEETLETLKSVGLSPPRIEEYSVDIEDTEVFYTIMEDLTQNRKMSVGSSNGSVFKYLTNGEELKKELTEACKIIRDKCNVRVSSHGTEEEPANAIARIFLTQYKFLGKGRLVISDLNHISLKLK